MAETKKSLFKKIIPIIIIVLLTVGILTVGAIAIAKNIESYEFKSDLQNFSDSIDNVFQLNDTDTNYLYSKDKLSNYAPIYNLNGPLAVMFNEKYTESEKNEAIHALDETFEVLHNINPIYSYKICEEREFNAADKKIYFDVEEHYEISANIDMGLYAAYFSYSEQLIMLHRPCCSKETFKHELLHACGLKDVYDYVTKTVQGNTFINTKRATVKSIYKDFYPNDVRLLAILNIDKNADLSEKQRVADYVNEYEKTFNKKVFALLGCDSDNFSVAKNFKCCFKCDYKEDRMVKINFSDNGFTAEVYDGNGAYLERVEGGFVRYSCGVVITNFKTKTLFYNEEFIDGGVYTLYIMGNGKAKVCKIYSVFLNKKFLGSCV